MNMHRNPCGFCGHFDHFDSECYLADPEVEDEPTISTLTMEELRGIYLTEVMGDPLISVEPKIRRAA